MKTFKQLREKTDHLDLYRRFSTGINKDLIKGNDSSSHYTWLKNYDTSGKGQHEYEHHSKKEVLSALDHHTDNPSNKLKHEVTSYSGVSSELGHKLHQMSKTPGHTFSTPAFISSSHDKKIAHKFAETNNNGQKHVMVFHLPKGYHKSKSIPNAREGGRSRTDERLFARNQKFKHIKSEKIGNITYHHYEPEK